jgi:diguanylate cyclase (GGDEF)-like protein
LRALYEVAHTLSGNLGVRHTSELVVRKVEEIYPGATCVFLLREPDSNRLVADSVHGVSRELFVNAYTTSDTSLSCRVLESNRSVAGAFDNSDLTFVYGAQNAWSQPKTSLIVPVYSDGRPVGTINLYHQSEHAFSDYDRELLELIAERASSALYNGILFERARGDSLTDPLTGTYNLRYLNEHVESLVGKDREFSLLCLDLDSFKPVNDLFGHAKGNTILKDIAHILGEIVGNNGIVSRYGGDEFVVVLSEVDRDEAQAFVVRLQEAVIHYEPQLDHPKLGQLKVGVSVGLASYPEDGLDCSSLLSVADHRMYIMKTERKLIPLAKTAEGSFGIDLGFDPRYSKVS